MRVLKLNFLIIVLLVLNLSSSYGQTYNEIVTQAYSYAYIDNDYKKAAEFFDKAFETEKAKSTELYYASEVNLNLNNIDKFTRYLSEAVDRGYANHDFLIKQRKFKTHFTDAGWDSLLAKTKRNYSIFEKEYENLRESVPGYYQTSLRSSGKIDLRTDSLKVKHQGKRNTCSVFAATALIEYLILDKYKKAVDMSESYNYWAAKTYTLTNDYLKESYTSVDGLAGYLAVEAYKYGSMDEKNWKYEKTNWMIDKDERCKKVNGNYVKECFTGVPPEKSKKAEFTAHAVYIDREDIGQYLLQEKKPVIMNIFWYFDAVNEKGEFRIPTEEEIKKGGHVILLVGYDSIDKTFIFQNSWGNKWGREGYGRIPEEYILSYYELSETFPYGIDISEDEKSEAIKGSMGVSALLD
jgi:C1A family cysteine protease